MDHVASLHEAALVHGRGSAISPAVDANLRERIRSLLIARNRHQPPKTPCPSPDHNYLPCGPGEKLTSNSPRLTWNHKFSPTQAVAKLIELEYEVGEMGATRFDGPAGQIENDDADVTLRRPSQPNMEEARNTRTGWAWSRPSGLDYRAQHNVLGQESLIATTQTPKRTKSSASKKSNRSRVPRFYLRTVPPATDVNRNARPKPQHIPGSYKLDVMGNDILAVPTYTGLRDEYGHNAIDALHELKDYGCLAGPSEGMHSTTELPIPRTMVASEISRGQQHEDILAEPVFVIGSDHEEDNIKGADLVKHSSAPQKDAVPQSRQHIASSPASSCHIESSIADQSTNDHVVARARRQNQWASSSVYSPSVRSVVSVPMQAKQFADSVEAPLLPSSSTIPAPSEMETAAAVELPRSPISSATPEKSQKQSPVSRAMSMLSEISARSGIQAPSLQSLQERMKRGSSTLTARPSYHRKHPSRIAGHHQTRMIANRGGYQLLEHDHQRGRHKETDSTNGIAVRQQDSNQGETFAKVITDLEDLLKEALDLAGHAASRDHSNELPLHLHPRPKTFDQVGSRESADCSECVSSLSEGVDEEDNHTTLPYRRIDYDKGHVDIGATENNHSHGHSDKARNATTFPGQTLQLSTIPHQGGNKAIPELESTHREFLRLPRTSSKTGNPTQQPFFHKRFSPTDLTVIKIPSKVSKVRLEMGPVPPPPQTPPNVQIPWKEHHAFLQRDHGVSESTLKRGSIREYVETQQRPPIETRVSSIRSRKLVKERGMVKSREEHDSCVDSDCDCVPYIADFKTSALRYHPVYRETMAVDPSQVPRSGSYPIQPGQVTAISLDKHLAREPDKYRPDEPIANKEYSLKDRHHFSIHEPRGFSLSRSHRRSPIARDWSIARKRCVAIVACITTAFMGLVVGIYAGEVPAIQYTIADEHHYTILGNVFFFLGLAITTALFYPLPLLHGRKPYTLAALTMILPLQFPQAVAINSPRSPNVATYRIGLLLPRIFAGIVMGFANINSLTTLLDLFGASLQSGNPHQELVNNNDVRRHGGGMGVWLGIWTFSAIGSIGIGFLIGAGIVSGLDVSWGFWITIIINAAVLLLNVVTPETRRSAYRRSMAQVQTETGMSRRVARGEIKMHLQSTGPIWWGEEVFAGHILAIRMLKQPGFAILSLYLGWIYGQVVLVIVVGTAHSKLRLETYICTASRRFAVQVLSFPSPVRWISCSNHSFRCSIGNPVPESLLVQPFTTPSSKDGQYDI